jgi:membrane associated rhomboid family serine protease
MIPIRDHIPTRQVPVLTILLIATNAAVFLFELLLSPRAQLEFTYAFGAIPYYITHYWGLPTAVTLVTSMFLHGGWLHILGNMLYLWIFGNNVEDAMGRLGFTVFYFACGLIAGLAQVYADPNSQVPGIGASGAIAGVLGAYLVLYPRARVDTLFIIGFFIQLSSVPAVVVLGFWFVLQLLNGVLSLGMAQAGGVAWFAHVGGFVAGLILVNVFAPPWRRRGLESD